MKHLRLWTIGCCLAGLIAGIAWPPPPIPRTSAEAGEWALPSEEALSRYSGETFQQAQSVARWDEQGTVSPDSSESRWRLAGLLNDPSPVALILAGDKPTKLQRIMPGGLLPDGSRLMKIDNDKITTQQDSCELVYQLYRPIPISASPTCETVHGVPEQGKAS